MKRLLPMRRFLPMMGFLFAPILGLATPSAALACDNPGTPNPVTAQAVDANTVVLNITNTASEGPSHDIWFLVQDRSGNVRRFTQGHIPLGYDAIYNVTGLEANKQQCFEVWTRDDSPQGCRSQKPSGWVCVNTTGPFPGPVVGGPGTSSGTGSGSGSGGGACCPDGQLVCPAPRKFCKS